MKTTRDEQVSAKIVAIRVKAGGSAERCTTCCRPADAPYRRWQDDRIVEGCVDAVHTAHMFGISSSGSWHRRPVAQEMRRVELARLQAL